MPYIWEDDSWEEDVEQRRHNPCDGGEVKEHGVDCVRDDEMNERFIGIGVEYPARELVARSLVEGPKEERGEETCEAEEEGSCVSGNLAHLRRGKPVGLARPAVPDAVGRATLHASHERCAAVIHQPPLTQAVVMHELA